MILNWTRPFGLHGLYKLIQRCITRHLGGYVLKVTKRFSLGAVDQIRVQYGILHVYQASSSISDTIGMLIVFTPRRRRRAAAYPQINLALLKKVFDELFNFKAAPWDDTNFRF